MHQDGGVRESGCMVGFGLSVYVIGWCSDTPT